uniref:Tail tube protein n=1 Tax=Pseudomonas phage Touem01 TaxID=3138548 RepID=A0AAU6W1M5_9VIRU
MRQNRKVKSGNRIVITYDGFQVGLIQSVRMNDDYSPEPASGIGDIHVAEWVPTMARHSLTVSRMILETDKMRERGIMSENGDAVLEGLVFDIETYAKDDGTLLRKYIGCSYASGDLEVSKHQILMGSGQFNALDVSGAGA